MKVIALSDTHNQHKKITIPECDILIHVGDWSSKGTFKETKRFAKWLNEQPSDNIIVVPGNHEIEFERGLPISKDWILDYCSRAKILIDDGVEINGYKIWGSPVTPWFHSWAWNRGRGEDIKKHWDLIPNDTDLLLTHGPPVDILDIIYYADGTPKERV